nr:LLM class flavin-dependent oxidoreductase [Pseudarthrobacter psychrotolerans]
MSPEQNHQDLLERARLADQVGLHHFGVGEHHRADYSVTSPSTVLAAVAAQTKLHGISNESRRAVVLQRAREDNSGSGGPAADDQPLNRSMNQITARSGAHTSSLR